MKISNLKLNPKNPRIIKDDKFEKLIKSIQEFPKMMELRPIVIDSDNMILGGNMRFKALKELKYTDIPNEWIKRTEELTEDEKRRFIIADNVGFGEHDWDVLANEWDVEELSDWGLDIPNWSAGIDANNMIDDDVDLEQEFDPIGESGDYYKVSLVFKSKDDASLYFDEHKEFDVNKKGQIWTVNMNIQSI